MHLKIGTRSSTLARAQAEKVAHLLTDAGTTTELVFISTVGDERTTVPLHEIGGQGVFVRALDDALLDGRIDIAVHSMKDIPAERPAGLITAAILKRDSPADYLVTEKAPESVRIIGTSSTRRTAQILRYRPGTEIRPLRGNVDTRLAKLRAGEYDAIILAEAGLERLSLSLPGVQLSPQVHVPSTNQGTIAVVSRDEKEVREILSSIDHPETRIDTMIERTVMEEIEGGCFTPLGVYCHDQYLIAEVLSLEGDRVFRLEKSVRNPVEARQFGREIRAGAGDLIREAYERLGIS
ncbi:MAG TPA: hydroxymethylbilane synthase [Methanospirillum sp.]|nr:hydroxymethylbilane synthase [Methanospirillum sp.]